VHGCPDMPLHNPVRLLHVKSVRNTLLDARQREVAPPPDSWPELVSWQTPHIAGPLEGALILC
jgi:hypothetical protein